MATRVTLPPLDDESSDTTDRSPLPVSKVQLTNDRADRQAEAAWLRRAARPGIVELLSTATEPFTIVTAHAGSATLRTAALDPDTARRLMVQVAELVATLHRDDLVHGKLTLDHIIVSPQGPVLCSPDGAVDDPHHDLAGLARCLHDLARQWAEQSVTPGWISAWATVADRLEAAEDPARSALRTAQALRAISVRTTAPATTGRRRPPPALIAAAGVIVAAVAFVPFLPSAAAPTGPEVVIGTDVYAIGSPGDDVVHLERPCESATTVVLLRPDTSEVWAFDDIDDGQRAELIAIVPGATTLRTETDPADGCHRAVASGPAGRTTIRSGSAAVADTDDEAIEIARP